MENLMIVVMTAAVSLLTSLTCWLIVGPQLKHVLASLCNDEELCDFRRWRGFRRKDDRVPARRSRHACQRCAGVSRRRGHNRFRADFFRPGNEDGTGAILE